MSREGDWVSEDHHHHRDGDDPNAGPEGLLKWTTLDSFELDHEEQRALEMEAGRGRLGSVGENSEGYHVVGNVHTRYGGKRAEIMRVYTDIRVQLIAVALYSFFALSKALVFFPFIRTTIRCDNTLEAVNQHSREWSGSTVCSDQALVARDAQFIKGLSEGLDQAVHCLMLPLLGHMLDVYGRRSGVMLGMTGVLVQSLCFWLASVVGFGTGAHVWIITGSIMQGATGVFMASVNASVRDMQNQSTENTTPTGQDNHGSTAFGLVQVSQGMANAVAMVVVVVSVLSRNLSVYDSVWFTFCLTISIGIVWLYFFFPETLPSLKEKSSQQQQWDWRKASPWSLVELFFEENTRYLAGSVFFVLLSISSLSTLQAFTVAIYHWTQTFSTVIFMILSPIAVSSIAASFFLIPRVGPKAVVAGSLGLTNVGSILLCFVPFSPAFFFAAMACLFAASISLPAFMQIVTSMSGPHDTGQLLANFGAVALAAVAAGNLIYGTLFRTFTTQPALSFIVAFPVMLLGTLCAYKSAKFVP